MTIHGWHVPGWATPHNLALIAGALVILMLAAAVLRLAGGRKPTPAPAPKPSSSGKGTALLVAAAAAVGGWVLWKTRGTAAAKAAPAPQPTVTVTAPPKSAPVHFTMPHIDLPHLTGTQWTVITVVALVLTYAAARPLLRRSS